MLYSVALTESKVLLRGEYVPWPWTLNVAGKSYYYATVRVWWQRVSRLIFGGGEQ